jgi:glycerate kinase
LNILVAMDSLKGSLSSLEANKAIVEGLSQVSSGFKIQTVPIADGGEGTVKHRLCQWTIFRKGCHWAFRAPSQSSFRNF